MLLKEDDTTVSKGVIGRFFDRFNSAFDAVRDAYTGKVGWMISHLKYAVCFLVIVVGLMGLFYKLVPTTFVPNEDQGMFIPSVTMPEGTSMNQMVKVVDVVAKETKTLPGVDAVMTNTSAGSANLFVRLKDWDERTGKDESLSAILSAFNQKIGGAHPEAQVMAFGPSALPGLGMEGGWAMQVQDNTDLSDEELGNLASKIVAAVNQRPELSAVCSNFKANTPSYEYQVDREKVKSLGIQLSDVFTALQVNFGGTQVNDFKQFGRSYKVMLQADTRYRSEADSLKFISVKSKTGDMIPLDTIQVHHDRPVLHQPFQWRALHLHPRQRREWLQLRRSLGNGGSGREGNRSGGDHHRVVRTEPRRAEVRLIYDESLRAGARLCLPLPRGTLRELVRAARRPLHRANGHLRRCLF